jgi:hypothetical protein
MSDEFDATLHALDDLEVRLIRAVESGLDAGAPGLEQAAQATTSYGDRSGATRAGTVAYRTGDVAKLGEALAAVEGKNPGQGLLQDSAPIPDTERQLILTVPTRYQEFLEAGDTAFLASTVLAESVRLAATVRDALQKELQR